MHADDGRLGRNTLFGKDGHQGLAKRGEVSLGVEHVDDLERIGRAVADMVQAPLTSRFGFWDPTACSTWPLVKRILPCAM